MEGIPATYLGRIVSKENFRVFIFDAKGTRKLVNSWEAFENHMQTGLWFTRDDLKKAQSPQDVDDKKSKKIKKVIEDVVKDIEKDNFIS